MPDKTQEIAELLKKGYSEAQINKILDEADAIEQKKNPGIADAAKSTEPVNTQPAKVKLPEGYEEPEWFTEAGFNYKEDTKIRHSFLNRAINLTTQVSPLIPDTSLPEVIDEGDKLTPEMVSEVDAFSQNDLDYQAKNVRTLRSDMQKKYNANGSKITNRNIDFLIEEATAPKLVDQINSAMIEVNKAGKTKRDLLLSDPKIIQGMKAQYRERGWSGDIVDQAFSKALTSKKDDILYNDQLATISKMANDVALKTGRNPDDVQREYGEETEKDRVEYAESLFGKEEMERRRAVKELEFLKKDPETNMLAIADKEKRIKELQGRLQLDMHIDWAGSIVNTLTDPLRRPNVAQRYTYGAYDENGDKVIHGKMSDEEKQRQSEITAKMNDIKENPNFKQNITKQAQRQFMILQNLKLARKQAHNEINDQLSLFQNKPALGASTMPSSEQMSIMAKGKRTTDNIDSMIHEAEVSFEALSRMELLNQDVAMEDKTLMYYLGDAGSLLANKNNFLNLYKNKTSDAEQVEVARKLYADMGYHMDDEELKNTAPDLALDITRGATELTDFAVKMILLDKVAGVNGLLALTTKMKKVGGAERLAASFFEKSATTLDKLGMAKAALKAESAGLSALSAAGKGTASKIAANVTEAAVEGLKFEVVGGSNVESKVGGFETGLAFYEVGKLMPNVRIANKAFNVIANGFLKSSTQMTASMEAVAGYEAARNAIANDKDFGRAMEENGIIGWGDKDEVFRRVIVEMVTAAPFGLRAMTSARESGFSNTTYVDIKKAAQQLRDMGQPELAVQLEMSQVAGVSPEGSKHAFKIKDQLMYLREAGEYNPSKKLDKNLERYQEIVEELGYDPITDQMLEAHNGELFGVSMAKDVVLMHEKIEYLKKAKIDIEHNSPEAIEKKYQEQAQLDLDSQIEMEGKIINEAININGKKPVITRTQEQNDLAKIKEDINNTKKSDVDWDALAKEEGTKVRDVFSRLRDRIGEKNFTQILNEAIGMTRMVEGERGKIFDLLPKDKDKLYWKGFSDKEVFDSFVDTMQSLRSDNRKSDAINRIEFLQEVMDRMEVIHNPAAGYVETISNRPSYSNMVTLPEMTLLKEQIKSFKRGSVAGRKEFRDQLKVVQNYIRDNAPAILDILKNTKMTVGDIMELAKPLKANASDATITERINKIDAVIKRMEHRSVKKRITDKIKSLEPSVTKAGIVKGGKVDFITASKVGTVKIRMLFSKAISTKPIFMKLRLMPYRLPDLDNLLSTE